MVEAMKETTTGSMASRTAEVPGAQLSTARHPGDAIRVALGAVVLFLSLLGVERDRLTRFETDLFRLVNDLPDQVSFLLGTVMQLGNVLAAPAVGLALLVVLRRHRRVAIDVTAAGFAAWFAAKFVKDIMERPRPGGLVEEVNRIAESGGLGFVSGHTAVAAAIVTASGPYLSRRARRAIWVLPWAVGGARIYYGAHLPLDVIGGVALGWIIGAGLHVAFGAPHRMPTLAEAGAALRRVGFEPTALERVLGTHRGSFPFVATVEGSPVFIKLLDPEPRDRDWLYRLARFLAFRDVRDEVVVADARGQAHREAAMALLAATHGVRVPRVQRIVADGDRIWIMQEHVPGTTLEQLPADAVTDQLLAAIWMQLDLLRGGGIAHRDLVASNILVDAGGRPWLVDFAHAETSPRERALDNDAAELLVTTALVAGSARAVAAAERVMDRAFLSGVLPEIQPLVLTAESRQQLRHRPDELERLRSLLRAPSWSGPVAEGEPATSATGRAAAVVVVWGLVLIGLLAISGVDAIDELVAVRWRWLGLAVVAAAAMTICRAAALVAAIDRRLALGRMALVRIVEQGVDVTVGQGRGRSLLAWYLARAGVPAADSSAGSRRLRTARWSGIGVAAVAATAAALAAGASLSAPDDAEWLVLFGVFALVAEIVLRPYGAPAFDRPDPADVRARPSTLLMLGLTSVAEIAAGAVVTVAVVAAMGGGATVTGVAALHVAVVGVTTVAPLRGTPGIAMVLFVAGFAALGMPLAPAVAASVVLHVLYAWVPAASAAVLRRTRAL